MKWIGERISFVDKKDYLTIVIYPPNIGFKRILILLWTILWYAVGAMVFSQLFLDYSDQEIIFIIIFLSFWLYYAVRVTRTLLYLYFSREFIKVDKTALRIKKSTGKYGVAKQYFIENIAKFKTVELKERSFQSIYEDSPWVRGTDKLQFDYLGKNISFGRKLNEKETALLFKLVIKKIEQHLRKK
jgi:hypothetical protein